MVQVISKILSANDTGDTGGHQAGILVPKDPRILSFFPPLYRSTKNPRHALIFIDRDGKDWGFSFIYYNNKFFGGTRNEYRLTCMTRYIRENRLVPGDTILLGKDERGALSVNYERREKGNHGGILKLSGAWTVVKI